MSAAIPEALVNALFVPVPFNQKIPSCKWGNLRLSAAEVQPHLRRGGNLALRVGRDSGALVDVDLDCSEALVLADLYLPPSGAIFGRSSKPRSHRIFRSPGSTYSSFGDPIDGSMLFELRTDGRDGGAHLTIIPPSVTSGERRAWVGDTVEPAVVEAAILQRRMTWLAIACLTHRHISEYMAERPGPDLPAILWEADQKLGRPTVGWGNPYRTSLAATRDGARRRTVKSLILPCWWRPSRTPFRGMNGIVSA